MPYRRSYPSRRRAAQRPFRGTRGTPWVRKFYSAQNQSLTSAALNGNYVATLADNPVQDKINSLSLRRISINAFVYAGGSEATRIACLAEISIGLAVDTADFRAAMQDPNARLLRRKFSFDNFNGGSVQMWVPKGFTLNAKPAFAGAVPLHCFIGINVQGNCIQGSPTGLPKATLAVTYEQLARTLADT